MYFRLRLTLIVILLGGLVAFIAGDVAERASKHRAFTTVRELGGHIGSLPCWPFGDEIVISFRHSNFSRADLNRLAVLVPLTHRNSVMVIFHGSTLRDDEMIELRKRLPKITFSHGQN